MDTDHFIEIRKHLHQHPELSSVEYETSKYIHQKINKIWKTFTLEVVGETALIFTRNVKNPNLHIAFRAELDALPIHEKSTHKHVSNRKGIAHSCGHDGHMTILLRLAHLIAENPLDNIDVSLIFQAAEEIGTGAKEIVQTSKLFETNKPNKIFALHNVPGFPISSVITKSGIITPAVTSVRVKFHGKTAHAAQTYNGINPTYTMAEIIIMIQNKEKEEREHPLTIAPIETNIGSNAYGTSAGSGMMGFTIRSQDQNTLTDFKVWLENNITEKCQQTDLTYEIEWFEEFHSVVNSPQEIHTCRKAARDIGLPVMDKKDAFEWGEDFGLYTEVTKGCLVGLGAGTNHAHLHNPDYDFPDALIESGSNLLYQIAKTYSIDQ